MDLSIIIVNWNSKEFVRRCLHSLERFCPAASPEIIVVDGASYDGCDAMLRAEFPRVVFVQSPTNVGFGRANNLGARHATRSNLLLLNPDTEFIENALTPMLEQLARLPRPGAVGCRLLNADRSVQTSCVQSFPTVLNQLLDSDFLRALFPRSSLWGMTPLFAPGPEAVAAEAISGACVLVQRTWFEAVGGFTDSYFMYGEDLDLSFKLQRAGRINYHLPATKLVHLGGGSSRQAASNFSTVMMRQSVLQFIRQHRGAASAAAFRTSTAVAAVTRLLLIGPLLLFGRRVVRHGPDSWRKWTAILRWALGLDASVRARAAKSASASIVAENHA
jgi:GT2 family glycosyltransferase